MRPVYPAVLLVSAAAIGYEILLMRVLSIVQWHHFAYMIISLALFGYAASGTVIALARHFLAPRFGAAVSAACLLFAVTMVVAFHAAQRAPFNALAVIWDPAQLLGLAAIYLVCMVPFFFAACCIGLAFTWRNDAIGRIYLFDLLGAGIGGPLIILALFRLAPQHALLLLAAMALAASAIAALAAVGALRRVLAGLQLGALVLLVAVVPGTLLDLRLSEYKGLSQAMQVADTSVLDVRSSPLGLLTVVASPTIPFRHAPGMSLAARTAPGEQLAVFTDGDDLSVITRFDGDLDAVAYIGDMTSALPYRLLDAPRVLVLGAGGGAGVLQALYHRAGHIDAVELNPQMVELVRNSYAGYAGRIYEHESVNVHVAEARGFVAQSKDRYDLVQVALLDSFATSGSGAQGLSESYLYTVEALALYIDRLAPDGMLSITRWLRLPPRDSLKLAATAIEALRRSGAADPAAHLAVIRSWNTVTMLVGRSPLSAAAIDEIRAFSRSRSFDLAWYPGMQRDEADRYNRLGGAPLYTGIAALLGDGAAGFVADYKFDVSPATDDRPYFFHFFKWRVLPEMVALARQGGAGIIEWGYLVLVATILQGAVAGFLVILLPLRLAGRHRAEGAAAGPASYFFLLGLAFLFVEIAFIQKFILFLSHPLYSVAVVLSGFLVFAGLGSGSSGLLARRARRAGVSPVAIAVAGIAAIAIAYTALLPAVFDRLVGASDPVRIATSIALIAPLAFCMGMPFPLGLGAVARKSPGFVPWAWGINGFASVVSASLATLLAIEFGFTVVLVLAICLYAAAAALLPGRYHAGA